MGDSEENVIEAGTRTDEQPMPSLEEQAVAVKKKYGGIMPKKPPHISKDHEKAFFDSADWALGKQGASIGQKPKSSIETLRPKLQPTPHQPLPSRRASYVPPHGEGGTDLSSEEST